MKDTISSFLLDVDPALQPRISRELNFYHEPVKVPRHQDPFNHNQYAVFAEHLERYREEEHVPEGFLETEETWRDDPFENLTSGRRSIQRVPIELPMDIWFPRALLWAQAVKSMEESLIEDDNENMDVDV